MCITVLFTGVGKGDDNKLSVLKEETASMVTVESPGLRNMLEEEVENEEDSGLTSLLVEPDSPEINSRAATAGSERKPSDEDLSDSIPAGNDQGGLAGVNASKCCLIM